MLRDRKHVVKTMLVAAVLLAAAGCVHMPGGIAPSNIPLEGRKYRVIGDVTQTDNSIWILGLFPVTGSNTTRGAIHDALREKNADALIGVTVESYNQYWILFSRHATMVHGQAIKFESAPSK